MMHLFWIGKGVFFSFCYRQGSGKLVLWPHKLRMAQPFDCAIL